MITRTHFLFLSNLVFFSSLFRFKSGLYRDKSYPRTLVNEEPYVEPTKLERLSLRDTKQNQWVTEKVRLEIINDEKRRKKTFCFLL